MDISTALAREEQNEITIGEFFPVLSTSLAAGADPFHALEGLRDHGVMFRRGRKGTLGEKWPIEDIGVAIVKSRRNGSIEENQAKVKVKHGVGIYDFEEVELRELYVRREEVAAAYRSLGVDNYPWPKVKDGESELVESAYCYMTLTESVNLLTGQPERTKMNSSHPGWLLCQKALSAKGRGWSVRARSVAAGNEHEDLIHVGDFAQWAYEHDFEIHSERFITSVIKNKIPLTGYHRKLLLLPPALLAEKKGLSSLLNRVIDNTERDETKRRIRAIDKYLSCFRSNTFEAGFNCPELSLDMDLNDQDLDRSRERHSIESSVSSADEDDTGLISKKRDGKGQAPKRYRRRRITIAVDLARESLLKKLNREPTADEVFSYLENSDGSSYIVDAKDDFLVWVDTNNKEHESSRKSIANILSKLRNPA